MAGNVVAGNVHVGANIDTPPQTPQENTCKPESVRALQASEIGPRIKAKKTNVLTKTLISDLKKALLDNDLGSVLGYTYSCGDERDKEFVQETFSAAFSIVAEKNGYKKALKGMLHEDVYEAFLDTMKVPDWVQLLVKLNAKIPDRSWQTMLNFLNLGKSGVSVLLYTFVIIVLIVTREKKVE